MAKFRLVERYWTTKGMKRKKTKAQARRSESKDWAGVWVYEKSGPKVVCRKVVRMSTEDYLEARSSRTPPKRHKVYVKCARRPRPKVNPFNNHGVDPNTGWDGWGHNWGAGFGKKHNAR